MLYAKAPIVLKFSAGETENKKLGGGGNQTPTGLHVFLVVNVKDFT